MIRHFDCDSCGAHGKITFKEQSGIATSEVAYCPFCGGDIYEDERYEDEPDSED